jgi:zinc protease
MAFSFNKREFNNFLEDIGASKNAFTSIQTICFHEMFQKDHIEDVFKYEAKRMVSFRIENDDFVKEKKAIQEEWLSSVGNNPSGMLHEAAMANIFNRECGGIGILGWKHEIETIKEEDLYTFHQKWFAPNNAIIIISGDFDFDQIKKLAEQYFGEIPTKKIEEPSVEDRRNFERGVKEISYGSPKNGSLAITKYIYNAPFSSKKHLRKGIALDVAIMALNQPESFPKKILKDTRNCATGVSFCYIDRLFQQDIITAKISASSIDNIQEAENTWNYLQKRLAATGVTKSELEAVKLQYCLALAYRKDDIEQISNYYGGWLTAGYSLEEVQSVVDLVRSLSVEECNQCLREVFSQAPNAVIRTVPKGYDRE